MAKKLKRGQASPEPNAVVESTPIAEAVVAEKPKPQKTYFEPVKGQRLFVKKKSLRTETIQYLRVEA